MDLIARVNANQLKGTIDLDTAAKLIEVFDGYIAVKVNLQEELDKLEKGFPEAAKSVKYAETSDRIFGDIKTFCYLYWAPACLMILSAIRIFSAKKKTWVAGRRLGRGPKESFYIPNMKNAAVLNAWKAVIANRDPEERENLMEAFKVEAFKPENLIGMTIVVSVGADASLVAASCDVNAFTLKMLGAVCGNVMLYGMQAVFLMEGQSMMSDGQLMAKAIPGLLKGTGLNRLVSRCQFRTIYEYQTNGPMANSVPLEIVLKSNTATFPIELDEGYVLDVPMAIGLTQDEMRLLGDIIPGVGYCMSGAHWVQPGAALLTSAITAYIFYLVQGLPSLGQAVNASSGKTALTTQLTDFYTRVSAWDRKVNISADFMTAPVLTAMRDLSVKALAGSTGGRRPVNPDHVQDVSRVVGILGRQ
jgi:hypothetical protein